MRRRLALTTVAAALVMSTCGGVDDIEHLTREVCSQLGAGELTAAQAEGIMVDATRHGADLDAINERCGDDLSRAFED